MCKTVHGKILLKIAEVTLCVCGDRHSGSGMVTKGVATRYSGIGSGNGTLRLLIYMCILCVATRYSDSGSDDDTGRGGDATHAGMAMYGVV